MDSTRFASIAIVMLLSHAGLAVSAFPQSVSPDTYSQPDTDSPGLGDDEVVGGEGARFFTANTTYSSAVTIPPNLIVPDSFRPVVEAMLRVSPTFRRQCSRLANERSMVVSLTRMQPGDRSARASATFALSPDGRRLARVAIQPVDDQVELISHEMEHVIEQLDDVNLRALARVPGTGVTRCRGPVEAYETVRAVRAGRAAADEVRNGR